MIKKEKGVTLVALVITITVMVIVSSITIHASLERNEKNNLRKMINDIELLQDKVSNYYLKFGGLPILRNDSNQPIKCVSDELNFTKDSADNNTYYILDLEAMDGIALNYGKNGFKDLKQSLTFSSDIYIINEKSHIVYYIKGIEMEGRIYHYIDARGNIDDTIPPSSPQINVISGTQETDKEGNVYYTTEVEIEIIPGKDGISEFVKTKYSLDNGATWKEIIGNSRQVFKLSESGTHVIIAQSLDEAENSSAEIILEIKISIPKKAILSYPTIVDNHEIEDKNTGQYKTGTEIKIYAGDNSIKTEYSLNNGKDWTTFTGESKTISIMENGRYYIKARSWNEEGEYKEALDYVNINADIEESFKIGSYVNYDVQYTDMYTSNSSYGNYDATNGWRYFGTNEEGNHLIVSTGIPMILLCDSANEASEKWWDLDAEGEGDKIKNGILNNIPNIPYEKVEQGTTMPSNANTMIGLFEGTTRTDTNNESYIAVGDYFKSSTYASKIEKVTTFTEEDVIRTVVNVTKVGLNDISLAGGEVYSSEEQAYRGVLVFYGGSKRTI